MNLIKKEFIIISLIIQLIIRIKLINYNNKIIYLMLVYNINKKKLKYINNKKHKLMIIYIKMIDYLIMTHKYK